MVTVTVSVRFQPVSSIGCCVFGSSTNQPVSFRKIEIHLEDPCWVSPIGVVQYVNGIQHDTTTYGY